MPRKQASLTSISDTAAHNFLKSASLRESAHCSRIPGFMLTKLAKGGSWRWRYADPTGKRRTATVGSYPAMKPEIAAQQVLDWLNSDIDPLNNKRQRRQKAQEAVRDAERRTLRYYLETYYKPHMCRSWKPQNAKGNYQRIAKHFVDLLDKDMTAITRLDIDQWQRATEQKGRAYATIRRCFSALKTLLRHAVNEGVLSADPLANHKLLEPTLKDQSRTRSDPEKAERRLLTDKEIRGILSGLDLFAEEIRQQRRNSRKHGKPDLPDLDAMNHPHWFIPFCHMALHTGLRPGDLYSLTWDDLNIRFGRLTKVCEKTSHAIRREKKPAVVDMKLNSTIQGIMSGWHKDQGKPDSCLVFPSPKTGRQMAQDAHKKPWAHVKELAGISPGLNFYAFRHHFISSMLAAGVPVFTVAKLAGHKGVEMILSHYGHLCPDQAATALDIVAATISREQKSDFDGSQRTPKR